MKLQFDLMEQSAPEKSAALEADRFLKLVDQAASGKRPTYGQQMKVNSKLGVTFKNTFRSQQIRQRFDIPISYRVRNEKDYGLAEISMNGREPEYVRFDGRGRILQKCASFWQDFASPVHYLKAVAREYMQSFLDRRGESLLRSDDGDHWYYDPSFMHRFSKAVEEEIYQYVTLVGDGWHEMYRYCDQPELFVEWNPRVSQATLVCRTGVKNYEDFDWKNILRFSIYDVEAAIEVMKTVGGMPDVGVVIPPFQILDTGDDTVDDTGDTVADFLAKLPGWHDEQFVSGAALIAREVAGNDLFTRNLQEAAFSLYRSGPASLTESQNEAEDFLDLLEFEIESFRLLPEMKSWELPVSPIEILKAGRAGRPNWPTDISQDGWASRGWF